MADKAGKINCGIMWCDNQARPPRYYMGLTRINEKGSSDPYCTVEISCEQWHRWDTDGMGLRQMINKIKRLDPAPGDCLKCPA